eukprot:4206950-Prymnesium_polylepis.1
MTLRTWSSTLMILRSWSRASDAGQADSRADVSLVRVARPWAAAPKISAQAAAPRTAGEAARARRPPPASHRVRSGRH